MRNKRRDYLVLAFAIGCVVVSLLFFGGSKKVAEVLFGETRVGDFYRSAQGETSAARGGNPSTMPDRKTGRWQRFESTGGVTRSADGEGVFELLSVSPQETRMRFRLPELVLSETVVRGKKYSVVQTAGTYPTGIEGAPELPTYRCDFTVAVGMKRDLRMIAADVREIPCAPPIPSVGLLAHGAVEPPPVENPDIYEGGKVYPEEILSEYGDYWLRHVAGVGVAVRPVQYDFSRGVLLVAENMEFAFCSEANSADDYGELDRQVDFANLQTNGFANGELLNKARGGNLLPGHILIIVPTSWVLATTAFVEWKREIGFDVTVACYPLDTGEALSEFIAEKYADEGISHLILCGDCEDVPPAYTSKDTTTPGLLEPTSDIRYALLSGDDYVPDLFVSRVPSHDNNQLKGVFKKFISYEANPPDDDRWRGRAAFMGSNEKASNPPYKDKRDREIMAENYALLQDAGVLDTGCAEIYMDNGVQNNTLKTQLVRALNGGVAFLEYLGHGTNTKFATSGFSVTDAKSMQNGSSLPFIMSPVCDTGNFAYPDEDCLTEGLFLGSGNSFGVNGAIGVLASTSQTKWNPPIKSVYEFTNVLVNSYSENRFCSLGAMTHHLVWEGAKLAESYLSANDSLYYTKQMHLFGDCSMMPRFRALREILVEYQFVEGGTVCISVNWLDDGAPVCGAYVSMTDEDGFLQAVGCTDSNGEVTFNCPIGKWSFFVNDASARSVLLDIEYSGEKVSSTLPTMYIGLQASVSIIPSEWTLLELEPLDALPVGLVLSDDGVLSGTPLEVGEYELSFLCEEAKRGTVRLTIAFKVLPGVDANEDDKVTTSELLEFLDGLQRWNGDLELQDDAIGFWQRSGASSVRHLAAQEKDFGDESKRRTSADVYEVILKGEVTAEWLEQNGCEVKCVDGDHAWICADPICIERLQAADVTLTKCEEMVSVVASGETRSAAHYPSQAEMRAELDSLVASYPERCRLCYVGKTVREREILALRVSNLPEDGAAPQLLVTAAIHGNERATMVIALRLARFLAEHEDELVQNFLDKVVFYIVPSMNPDGCEAVTRYNATYDDLNRRFPDGVQLAPLGSFAEGDAIRLGNRPPEVAAFMRWCAVHRFSAALHLHTGDQLVCYPYGNVKDNKVEERFSPDNDLFVSLCTTYADQNPDISNVINAYDYYPVVGEVPDWQYRFLGTLAATVELTGSNASGKEPTTDEALETLWQNNLPSLLAWSASASTGISLTVVSASDGEPLPFAKVQATYGQAVFCDANGACHRTLQEGSYSVTVSASGYETLTVDNVFVTQGSSTVLSVALQPDAIGAHLGFSSLRNIPIVSGNVGVCVDTEKEGAVVATVLLPEGWNGNLLTGCRAMRKEEDGAFACLFLDAAEAKVAVSVEADANSEAENLVSAAVTWYQDAGNGCRTTAVKRHWLCAEPRRSTRVLSEGWNCIGFTGAFALDDSWDFWGYSGGGYKRLAKVLPGQGAWVFSDSEQELLLEGWDSEEDMQERKTGWSLCAAMRHLANDGSFLKAAKGTYVKPKRLFVGDAFWSFGKK